MRRSGKWMVLLDDRILELLEESDEPFLTASKMAEDDRIPYSRQYVSERCNKLAAHGLLHDVGNGVYSLTEEGEAYLEGEYSAAEGNHADVSSAETDTSEGADEV